MANFNKGIMKMSEKEMIEAFRPFLLETAAQKENIFPLVLHMVKPNATVYPNLVALRDLAVKLYASYDTKEKPVITKLPVVIPPVETK